MTIRVAAFIGGLEATPFGSAGASPPWAWTEAAEAMVTAAIGRCGAGYAIAGGIAAHESAVIEPGAVVKAPALLGPNTFVAAGAYLRGGVFLDDGVIIGPNAELKTSFLFAGAKLAHLNFVGDSVLGRGVNIEAGAIVANYRNERTDKRIRILRGGAVIETGVLKFGVLAGDGVRVGANAVVAPGAILDPGTVTPRLALIDQAPAEA